MASFKLIDNTPQIIQRKNAAVAMALEMIGLQCENYAVLLCPVDTGRLKGSLSHEVRPSEEMVIIGTNVEYAPYVEMGTSRMNAQPYLYPAVYNHTQEYFNMISDCLSKM